MKDLTSQELQNIGGGTASDYFWGALLAVAVVEAPVVVVGMIAASLIATYAT